MGHPRKPPTPRTPATKRSGGGRHAHHYEIVWRDGRPVIVFTCGTGYNPRRTPRDNDGAPLCARCAIRERRGEQLPIPHITDLTLFDLPAGHPQATQVESVP